MEAEKGGRKFKMGEFSPVELEPGFPVSCPSVGSIGQTEDGLPHLHDSLELGLCDQGLGMFQIGSRFLDCRPGDAVVISQREFHLLKALPGEKISWRFLNVNVFRLLADVPEAGEWCRRSEFFCGESFPCRFRPEEFPEIVQLIRRIFEEMQEHHEGFRMMTRMLVSSLLIELGRRYSRSSAEAPEESIRPEALVRIAPALKYLAVHSSETFPVAKLAQLCCVSEVHFRRLFFAAVGCSPVNYLLHLKLENAAAMLKGSLLSVDETARKCGFGNLSYFERRFKQRFGVSPRLFRTRQIRTE